MDIRHIMAQLGIPPMKFAIFAVQTFLSEYEALPFYKRSRRTHKFITRELPVILKEMIEEEKRNEHTPFD